MKKIFLCIILLTVYSISSIHEKPIVTAEPLYAKWGRLAMEKTKEKYPKADIIDYKHIGRMSEINTTMEKFKLWLREGEREFGVLVNIEFDKKTERVIAITFKEVNR
ncbi:DUF3889 domain-containing protein [Robertmurraya andreesenii]|uniref:DUF3889 domain-containing protein n=1 Tax=Anoxybacillus andreesenii TaxID=1325932 RepID=A0ABT9V1H8_9BACL|nr:DUF3889 domain-containing protein [Robertmurraya andreesenii]MDQ0154813.1 hypothetical protein [Robertmurraya andreesenii]